MATRELTNSVLTLVCTEDSALAIQAALQEVRTGPVRLVRTAVDAESVVALGEVSVLIVHVQKTSNVGELIRLVRSAAGLAPAVSVLVIGEPDCGETGIALLRSGATDYLERPLDIRRFARQMELLLNRRRAANAPRCSTPPPARRLSVDSRPMKPAEPSPVPAGVMAQVHRIAGVDITVLLLGETGTGKSRLARIVHDHSPRVHGPFLVVNCATLSANLIESELFGHVKGAFTGADRDRIGKCEAAAGGTMFLDEVDSLPVELQAKLLRLVEEREFEPVGSNRPVKFDARLVAASNIPLDREVQSGRFRSDLYYRLNVVSFELPPLRDRADEIPALAEQFLAEFADRANRSIAGIDPVAMARLAAYPWPGNIRELRNVMERAVAMRVDGVVGLDDLTDAVRTSAVTGPVRATTGLSRTREIAEADRIVRALRRHHNNRVKTAAELGVSRMTLYNKLRRYGLDAGAC